jgi:hypothetical protein
MPEESTDGKVKEPSQEQPARPETRPTPPAPVEPKHPTGIHLWADTGNKIVQILAVFVAAWWTYSLFSRTSAPGLESKLSMRSELHGRDTSRKDVCTATFHVWAKNDGLRSFDLDRVAVTAQILDLKTVPKPAEGAAVPINPKFVREHGRDITLDDIEPIPSDLLGHYAPAAQNDSEVTFRFQRLPDHFIVFKLDLGGRESKVLLPLATLQPVSNYTWASDQLCGQKVKETE